MGSRIHREVYVRFRGEDSETCCCEAVRRRILSLQLLHVMDKRLGCKNLLITDFIFNLPDS